LKYSELILVLWMSCCDSSWFLTHMHSSEAIHCKMYFYMMLNTFFFFKVNEKRNTILGIKLVYLWHKCKNMNIYCSNFLHNAITLWFNSMADILNYRNHFFLENVFGFVVLHLYLLNTSIFK
jgi:hypothetical protein